MQTVRHQTINDKCFERRDFTLVFVHKCDLYMHRCTFKDIYIYILKREMLYVRSIYGMHIQRRIHSYRGRINMIERTRREEIYTCGFVFIKIPVRHVWRHSKITTNILLFAFILSFTSFDAPKLLFS